MKKKKDFHIIVVPCLVGHHLDHLIVLVLNLLHFLSVHHLRLLNLHFLIFMNKFWLAIGTQDIVGVREPGKKDAMLHSWKGEAAAAAAVRAGTTAAGLPVGGESQGEEGEEEADRG